MNGVYRILKEEVFSSPRNTKHQLVDATILTPDGHEVVWQYIRTRDVVGIVALEDQDRVFCVRQWRPARKDYAWELPAGGIEKENPTSDEVLENANRELQEEIGFKAHTLELLASFSPTIHVACTYYVVLARNLESSALSNDVVESVEAKALPFDAAADLLLHQNLPSALTLIGMSLARQYLHGK